MTRGERLLAGLKELAASSETHRVHLFDPADAVWLVSRLARLEALVTEAEGVLDNHPREPIEVCPWCGFSDPRREGHAKDCRAFSGPGVIREAT